MAARKLAQEYIVMGVDLGAAHLPEVHALAGLPAQRQRPRLPLTGRERGRRRLELNVGADDDARAEAALSWGGHTAAARRPLADLFPVILDLAIDTVGAERGVLLAFDNGQLKGFRVPGSRFRRIPREMLYVADEVFFCGTAAELTPVRSIDRITIGEGHRGVVTKAIQDKYLGIASGRIPDPYGWLTPVPAPAAASR